MASFSGFIRKSPAERLKRFFESRNVSATDDFDWSGEGRGTELVHSIEGLIAGLPEKAQDSVRAELDLLATLSDTVGLIATEQVCTGDDIDI